MDAQSQQELTSLGNSNRVHEGIEESSHPSERLEDGDTLSTNVEGEEFNEESCNHR